MEFKKSKKCIALLLICIILTIPFCGNVSAAENSDTLFGVSTAYGSFRWHDVRTNTSGNQYAHIKIDGDSLNSCLLAGLPSALLEWNQNSGGKVLFVGTDAADAECRLIVPTSSNWYVGNAAQGVTILYNSAGEQNYNWGPGITHLPGTYTGTFKKGVAVRGVVYFNPNTSAYQSSTTKQNYLLRHELGHVVGMAHVNYPDITTSIMDPRFDNFQTTQLQNYDRSVLDMFYPYS